MKAKKLSFQAICALAFLAAGVITFKAHAQCNVYMNQNLQAIDGFGFSTAWCGTLTSAKNQSLYGTLGMSLMRVQIVNDVNGATDGAWNYEQADTAAAHSYGAKVFGTDWYGPSGWDDTNTYLLPQYYGANAIFLSQCAQYTHLDWVSPANEPDYGWQFWTTNEFVQWTTTYGASIGVPLIEPESFQFSEPYSRAIVDNPNIPNSIMPIAGGHSYGVSASVHSAEIAAGKRVWMTEFSFGGGQDSVTGEVVPIGQQIAQYMNAQFNAYIWWWVYDTDTNANLVDESGNIHKNGYAIGQYAKWIRPGSTRVTADYNPQANVNVTAYNAYANGAVVIVAVNANNNSVSQSFLIHNGNATQLEGYQTSTNSSMADIGSYAVSGGSFTATLPAQSITTFVQTNAFSANLPSLWTAQDVGSVGIAGSAAYTNTLGTNGVFALTASGTDIWSTADAFRFLYETNNSNFTIIARVASMQNASALSKAGLMVRDSMNSNAANAFIAMTPGNGVTFQYRTSDGGVTSSNLVPGLAAPYWVELVGSGGAVTGYCSPDGISWTQVGSATLPTLSTAYLGLAVSAVNNSSLCTANFDNLNAPGWPTPPPPAPNGLTATAGIEQVTLTWQPSSYATNYIVQRATGSGGPYANIATVVGPRFVDTDVPGGTTYYYQVVAANAVGQNTNSTPVSATPTPNVLSPWLAQDIGAVNLPGSESFTNGVFTMYASGADIQSTADAFRFIYVTNNSTSFTVIARVTSVQNVNAWSKAGVMIRDSLNANGANAFIGLTPGNGVTWQYRSSDGGSTTYNNTTGLTAPYWVKLVRSGSSFSGYRSPDGVNWTLQGSATATMSSTVYVGLADTAHTTANLAMATFDNVNAPGFTPPSAGQPTGLTAIGGIEQVALNWQASNNSDSYNVYRSTNSSGPYTLVANVATTNYNDIQLVGNGTTYYYVVTGVNSLEGESAYSAQASATTTVTVPLPWMTQDIGSPAWGGASFTNGVFTVTGAGADIWNTADSFRFVYVTTNSANFTMIARVASLQNVNAWSKAGVMIRDSLAPGAANALIAVSPGNGVTFQYRSTDGGNCNNTTASGSAPYWVKLVGSGTTFTGYCSPNGTSWTQVGSTTLTNNTTAYIGLAVTSHANPSLCTATFDNVSGPGWPPSSLVLTAVAASSGQINLTWNSITNATTYNVKRSTTNGGPYSVIASGVITTNYQDTGLTGGTIYYYVVSAMVSGVETSNSAPASAATFSQTYGSLAHRYTFNETGGTVAYDSIGGPVWNGTLPNGGAFGNSQLTFASASQQYLSLPGGILSNCLAATIEMWVPNIAGTNTSPPYVYLFSIGNTDNNGLGDDYVFFNPNLARITISAVDPGYNGEQGGNLAASLGMVTNLHLTCVFNCQAGVINVYTNGTLASTFTGITDPLSAVGNQFTYIGRSLYTGDAYLNWSIAELRFYTNALSAAEIAASDALGPNQLLSTNQPPMNISLAGTNLTLSWPVANADFTLQSSTNLAVGSWVNVSSALPQIVNGQWRVAFPQSGGTNAIFYRLIK